MPSLIGNKPNQVPTNGDLGTLAFQDGVVPAGSLVGTTATQTLTNKTIDATQLVNASVTPDKLSTQSQYTGFKNRIINGDMRIDQRNNGASVNTNSGTTVYTLDRWQAQYEATSKFTVQQSSIAPAGFINSLLVTSSSAYSPTSTQWFAIAQSIEGLNIADFGWGTANAQPITVSFWVRSSLTGTFGGSITNASWGRSYPFSYTISAANTWEQKSVTIAGDTTGTWNTNTSTGLTLRFSLGTGSSISNTAGSWYGSQVFAPTGAVSVVGTNGATFYITGVQLEKGSTATSFDYRPYGTELALCQRYYQTVGAGSASNSIPFSIGQAYSTTAALYAYTLTPNMRATPTLSYSGVNTWTSTGSSAGSPTFAIETGSSERTIRLAASSATGLTAGNATGIHLTGANSNCTFSAEL